MNNLCVTSQLDDMLMSSAIGSDGPNQAGVFARRDSRISNNDKNYNMISNRISKRAAGSFFSKSSFG